MRRGLSATLLLLEFRQTWMGRQTRKVSLSRPSWLVPQMRMSQQVSRKPERRVLSRKGSWESRRPGSSLLAWRLQTVHQPKITLQSRVYEKLTKDGVEVPLEAFSAGLLEPKLNDPIGAGVVVFAGSADLPPKLNDPIGAGAALLVELDVESKENGADVFFGGSVALGAGADVPNENGVGAATIGVAVPELGFNLLPKKLGTSSDSLVGVVEAGAAGGLPRPKLNDGLLDASVDLGGANRAEGAAGVVVGGFDPDSEKNPFSLGVTRD